LASAETRAVVRSARKPRTAPAKARKASHPDDNATVTIGMTRTATYCNQHTTRRKLSMLISPLLS
jgi:hypothetical protein